MVLLCKHPFHLVAGDPDVLGERKLSAAYDRVAAAVADRNQKLVGRAFPHRRRHSFRHLAKQSVAGGMPKNVIDGFELVQIQANHCKGIIIDAFIR